ncbi:hypothetical protein [Mesobacillus maritimus]|uniref:hypothetical protein n=1 Tax=Mesobacillus maritimus TaxID=1643336 RepID=UPI00384B72B6
MWILTAYEENDITMFEFEEEKEARESFKNYKGTKILSHVIYFNDDIFVTS